jgi:elongation factor Ts
VSKEISAKDVKALRDRTGAGMMDAKNALVEVDGDMERAIELLRAKGQAQAAKRGGREASEGTVQAYIHHDGSRGAIVEIDCETDFVARTDEFIAFARDVAQHVVAARPEYVSEDEIPDEIRETEMRVASEQLGNVPEDKRERALEGKIKARLAEMTLLAQTHVNEEKHERKTLEELRAELAAKTGENIVIRRFQRFEVGE